MPEYQGNVLGDYTLTIPVQAAGANKVMFDLYSALVTAAGFTTGRKLLVRSVKAIKQGDVAVTGVLAVRLFLTRTSAIGTGGTAAVEESAVITDNSFAKVGAGDLLSVAAPGVTARAAPGGGATAATVLSEVQLFSEETTGVNYEGGVEMKPAGELIVAAGTGLRVVQGAVASVGNVSFRVDFSVLG